MSYENEQRIYGILKPYIKNPKVQEMKNFTQHGGVNTFQHCINVVAVSFLIAKVLSGIGLKIDLATVLIGALLHDFYLYDYHGHRKRDKGFHCFTHPLVARDNAKECFDLNEKQLNIIESHMFPATITHLPKSKEAFIVCIADKWCAVKELFHMRVKCGAMRHMSM